MPLNLLTPKKILYLAYLDSTNYHALEKPTLFSNHFDVRIFCVYTSTVESDEPDKGKMLSIKKYLIEKLRATNL